MRPVDRRRSYTISARSLSANDGDLIALFALVGVQRQRAVLDVALFVERDRAALQALRANITALGIEKSATVVTINSTGPFAMTYVNPADDPSKATAAKPY